jgi:NAD(P)-dependent dehydrogenase (short-subunit alcohol dehydrogenase family)
MSSLQPVLFILGAGPNIGLSVAHAFAARGYKIALATRSFQNGIGEDGFLRLKLDLTNTKDIPAAFDKVTKELGIPSVVIYNGTFLPPPFSLPHPHPKPKTTNLHNISFLFFIFFLLVNSEKQEPTESSAHPQTLSPKSPSQT